MSASAVSTQERPRPMGVRLHGLLAEFRGPAELKSAAARVRDAGLARWDCHSPFPVHGIDPAMGISMTKLPVVVFCIGFLGFLTAVALQWWTNAISGGELKGVPTFVQGYNFLISGKPFWSFPANIPVIFELTVLFSALTAGVGMLIANNLPWFSNPIFGNARFASATSDGFFISVDAADPKFHLQQTESFLRSLGAVAVERIEEPQRLPSESQLPGIVIKAGIVGACISLIPLFVIWMARNNTSTSPRFHLIQDMDNQEKYKAQAANAAFADGRAMRPIVAGAIARGDLREDDHFFRGYKFGAEKDPGTGQPVPIFFSNFPSQVNVDEALLHRGQQRFNIYCAPCHGQDGRSDGMVNRRALELGGGWVQSADLTDADRRSRPVGHLFNTITSGIRTMPQYGDQIPERDRWAIVAYVKALQKASGARIEDLPEKEREVLRGR